MANHLGPWLKQNLKTRKDWGIALTALVPVAMVSRALADGVVSIAAILFLVDCLLTRRGTWVRKPWIMAALLLWGYTVVRSLFVPDDWGATFNAFVWLRYIVFAACVSDWALSEERGRRWLIGSSAALVLFLSADGFIQYFFGRDILGHPMPYYKIRLTGIYTRPILGITIANFFGPVLFWLLEKKKVLASVAFATFCFVAVFLSGDRMGLILATVIMGTWFLFLLQASGKNWFLFIMAVPALLLGLTVFAPQLVERQVLATLATASELGSSSYGIIWKNALAVGKSSPVFGVGMRQFRKVCAEQHPEAETEIVESNGHPPCATHPHNAYLEWFSEGGFVGLAGFTGFVLTIAFGLIRRIKAKKENLVLFGQTAMLGTRLMPFFVCTSFFNNWSAIPFWLALGWAMSYKPKAS